MKNKNYILIIIFILISLLVYFNYIVNPPFKIDIVYTWAGENKTSDIRSAYNNELKYSLRSIMMFAPWVNRIYIIVNNNDIVPSWFNNKYKEKIEMVSLTDIMDKKFLPNTNSNAIETTFINIPNLSEHFIYFCDDFFIGKPVKWTDFFTLFGNPYITNFFTRSMHKDPNNKKINIDMPQYSISYKNYNTYWYHIPLPRLKSECLLFHKRYTDYINWIRNTKKRTGIGCNICIKYNLQCPCQQTHCIINAFMYKRGKASIMDYNNKETYIETNAYSNTKYLLNLFINNPTKYLCINDTNDNNFYKQHINDMILDFYEKYYYKKPFFEK